MLPILYRDDDLVAVHKPAGLLVHRSRLAQGERRFALQMVRDAVGAHVYPVHRLDRPTSGLLLFARSPQVARNLAEAFASRNVRKTYLAVVRGHPEERGRIDRPLVRRAERIAGEARGEDGPARPALTFYRRLATAELPVALSRYPTSRYALLALRPVTGRTHQIRRHLNFIAHPVVGDYKHGDYRHNRYFAEALHFRRLLLAATELVLPHPAHGRPLRLTAPLEASFDEVLAFFGWQDAVPARWRAAESLEKDSKSRPAAGN